MVLFVIIGDSVLLICVSVMFRLDVVLWFICMFSVGCGLFSEVCILISFGSFFIFVVSFFDSCFRVFRLVLWIFSLIGVVRLSLKLLFVLMWKVVFGICFSVCWIGMLSLVGFIVCLVGGISCVVMVVVLLLLVLLLEFIVV